MPKIKTLLAVAVAAATIAAGPAFAFSTEPTPTNPDGTARFTDPDALADGMADGLSPGGSGSAPSGYLHMFSAGGATVGLGMTQPNMGVVTSQGTLQRPYDPNDPSTQH